MTPQSQIHDLLTDPSPILVATHVNPDGDAIGSALGLAHLLAAQGKEGAVLLPQGLPERFQWLSCPWPLLSSAEDFPGKTLFALDCGDASRVGVDTEALLQSLQVVNIDHHTGNPLFGAINWVDPQMSSVGEMIALLAKKWQSALRGPMAEALYLAIVSDTGNMTYSNTTPQTLEIIAEIVAQGLDLDHFQARLQRQWKLGTVHLHGAAMQDLGTRAQGRIGIIRVSQALLEQTQTSPEDCEGLVNYVRRVRGVVVAVSLRESDTGIKFSLRTWGEIDVQAIAAELGGGGHPNAAGGLIAADMAQAEERLVAHIRAKLPLQAHPEGTARKRTPA